MTNMKKVLFILSNMSMGGAERTVSNITLYLSNEWHADILLNDTDDICFQIKGDLKSLNMKRPNSVMHYWYQLRVLVKRFFRLRYYKKNGCYDAYISFMDSSNIANLLSKTKGNYQTILSLRNSIKEHDDRIFYRFVICPLLKKLYQRADYIVTVSAEIEEQMKQKFPGIQRKLITINNGYDIKLIQKLMQCQIPQEKAYFYHGKFVIASMGRLSAQKGQWHLIRAFSQLAKKYEYVNLIIMGEGEERPYLEELIQGYQLAGRVLLTGNVENPFSYLKSAQVFTLSSMYEGFPNALAEAMCCELPCIVTDFKTGAREIMHNGKAIPNDMRHFFCADYGIITELCNGVQYSFRDVLTEEENMLKDAIEELLINDRLRAKYRQASKKRAEELDIVNVIKQWEKIMMK